MYYLCTDSDELVRIPWSKGMRLSDLFVGLFLPRFPMSRVILNCKQNYRMQSNPNMSHTFVDRQRGWGLFPGSGKRSLRQELNQKQKQIICEFKLSVTPRIQSSHYFPQNDTCIFFLSFSKATSCISNSEHCSLENTVYSEILISRDSHVARVRTFHVSHIWYF